MEEASESPKTDQSELQNRLESLEESIKELRSELDEANTTASTADLLYILTQQVKDISPWVKQMNSELIRIRAALEGKDENQAIDESNDRLEILRKETEHDFLLHMLTIARQNENQKN